MVLEVKGLLREEVVLFEGRRDVSDLFAVLGCFEAESRLMHLLPQESASVWSIAYHTNYLQVSQFLNSREQDDLVYNRLLPLQLFNLLDIISFVLFFLLIVCGVGSLSEACLSLLMALHEVLYRHSLIDHLFRSDASEAAFSHSVQYPPCVRRRVAFDDLVGLLLMEEVRREWHWLDVVFHFFLFPNRRIPLPLLHKGFELLSDNPFDLVCSPININEIAHWRVQLVLLGIPSLCGAHLGLALLPLVSVSVLLCLEWFQL